MTDATQPLAVVRALQGLQAVEKAVAVFAILAAAASLIADLLGRELFGQGIFGAQRAAVHLTFVAGMLGFVLATDNGEHLRIKATDHLLPTDWAPWIERLGSVLSSVILGVLAWHAFGFSMQTRGVGEMSVTLGIPIWPIQALMVYAFVSAGLRHILYALLPALRPQEAASQ
jgi:TRAP-type C4-dicarboxylate transport system permease small subunit